MKKSVIRSLRKQKKLTQIELSKIVGIGKNKMCDIERGNFENAKLKEMRAIAIALDSTIEEIFFK